MIVAVTRKSAPRANRPKVRSHHRRQVTQKVSRPKADLRDTRAPRAFVTDIVDMTCIVVQAYQAVIILRPDIMDLPVLAITDLRVGPIMGITGQKVVATKVTTLQVVTTDLRALDIADLPAGVITVRVAPAIMVLIT
jgi:hypothetical protein